MKTAGKLFKYLFFDLNPPLFISTFYWSKSQKNVISMK